MCIFSGPVERVANTRIFARRAENGRQVLVYQMQYESRRPVAMILPIPVAAANRRDFAAGDAPLVQFVSLKNYPNFFADMNRAFPVPRRPNEDRARAVAASAAPAGSILRVESIGDFVASFVPTVSDFRRLDKRFVLPPQTWNKIPLYHDYGFAVFQLKAAQTGGGVHPMAFSFASRYPDRLFFPTVHIHDEQVHPYEDFDHQLYWQPQPVRRLFGLMSGRPAVPDNAEDVAYSEGAFGRYVNTTLTKGLVGSRGTGVKARLYGSLQNRDTFVVDKA